MTEPHVDIRPMLASDDDLSAFRDCFERNGMPRRLDALRWQYSENPAARPLVDLAVDSGRVGGIYAVQPARVQIRGATALGVQSVDTLIDEAFRGRGLFTSMAKGVYARAAAEGAAFVYGFPNGNSAPGFFGKLGWASLDPVPFLVRPLRTGYLASKLPLGPLVRFAPNLAVPVRKRALGTETRIVDVHELGDDLDRLWREFSSVIDVAVVRDSRYLGWRLGKPGEKYQLLGLEERRTLRAFCAYTTIDKHGGRLGYVLELMHRPGELDFAVAALSEALRRMAADRADAALAWCFAHSPNARAYSRAGFLRLPERLRPIELHVGVRALDPTLEDLLARRESWYISYCDSDTV